MPSEHGLSDRERRFKRFHERVSRAAKCEWDNSEKLAFAPDFLDSLIGRIADPGTALVESTFAWTVLRAWGNSEDYAVHLYAKAREVPTATPLRQRDCALDVGWLRAGHRAEWLDAPLDLFREEARRRGVEPIDKSLISDAFSVNRARGTLASATGYNLVPVPSPKLRVGNSTEHLGTKGKSRHYQEFLAEWRGAHSTEVLEWDVARSTIKRINQVVLSAYKKWRAERAPQTNGNRSYKPLEIFEKTSVGRTQSSEADMIPAATTQSAGPPGWITEKLKPYLVSKPIGTPLDDPMLARIAAHLREELFEQFKAEADKVKSPRKWPVYEAVARQVAERGIVAQTATRVAIGESEVAKQYRLDQEKQRGGR